MADKINWDTVDWQYDEKTFLDTAKVVKVVNPKPWEAMTVEQLVERMKYMYVNQCRIEDRVIPWIATGGFYVCGTLRAWPTVPPSIYMVAAVSASATLKHLEDKTPAPVDKNWKVREIERFKSGDYKMVPWFNDPKWQEWMMKAPQVFHFVHMSKTDESKLSYTKNEENGEKDLKTRISPEKYLEQYVGMDEEYEEYIDIWLNM